MTRHVFRPAPLALAVSLMLGSSAIWAQPVEAASAGVAGSSSVQSIKIAAQLLGDALNAWARQTGVQIAVDQALVVGKTTTAIDASLTPQQALNRLLAGTGLAGSISGSEVVIRRTLPATNAVNQILDEVVVTDSFDGSGVTENSGSYTTGATSVATKMATSLKETPRSVSVMTNQQLKDQGLEGKNLEDVLRYAPGITVDDTAAFSSADANIPRIYSRGQRVTNIQIDGITSDISGATEGGSWSNGDQFNRRASGILALPDMVLFDHVEILRGPNSVFSGNGTPSATVNMVRKRPLKDYQLVAELSGNSWSNNSDRIGGRGTFDVTGTLPVLDGRLRGRFLASKADGAASFQDHYKSKRETLYGALEFDLTGKTVLGLNVSKEATKSTGIPLIAGLYRYHWGGDIGLPVGTNLTSPDTYTNVDTDNLSLYAKHEINNYWTLNINASYSRQNMQSQTLLDAYSNIYEDNSGAWVRFNTPINKNISQKNLDARVDGKLQIFGRDVTALVGVDHKNQRGESVTKGNYYTEYAIENLLDYNWGDYRTGLFSPYSYGSLTVNDKNKETGIYGSIKINVFDPLNFIFSARRARYESSSIANPYTPRQGLSQFASPYWTPITPTYSLTYDVNRSITAYASYSESYQDQSGFRKGTRTGSFTSIGEVLRPATGKNYELGVNGNFLKGRLNAHAVIYSMNRKNILIREFWYDPPYYEVTENGDYCCYNDSGKQESKGIDIGVSGEVSPGLQFSAGYTFNKNETVSEAVNATAGTKTHTRTPEHQLKVWSNFKPRGNWNKWNFGVGVVAQSKAHSAGTEAEYLGYDTDYVWTDSSGNPTGNVGRRVYSNEDYYATGVGAGLGFNSRGETYTLPYDFTQKPYAVFGLSAGYQFTRNWYAQLNVDNVFNKRYYRTIGTSTGGNYYGAPRAYTFTLRGTFD